MKIQFSAKSLLLPKNSAKVNLLSQIQNIRLAIVLLLTALTATSYAQSKLWMVGSKLLNFNNPNSIVVQSLPQPSVPPGSEERAYTGQIPKLSQFAEYDKDGNLLFFAMDGAIYDKDGYLMIKQGVTGFTPYPNYPALILDFQAIKIPGHCDKYYIVSGHEEGIIAVSVLDLNFTNQYWPAKKGGLLNFDPYQTFVTNQNEAGAASVYEINFYDFLTQHDIPGSDLDDITINGHSIVIDGDVWSGTPSSTLGIRTDLSFMDNNAGGDKRLIMSKGTAGYDCDVTALGIFFSQMGECLGFINDWPRLNERATVSYYNSNYYVFQANEMNQSYGLYKANSLWNSPDCLVGGTGDVLPSFMDDEVASSERSMNGRYLYFIQVTAPYFRYIDLNNLSAGFQNLTTINSVSGIDEYSDCIMALNYYDGVPSIYLYDDSGLAVIKNVDSPASATFVANPFPGLTLPAIDMTPLVGAGWLSFYSVFDAPRIVQSRGYNLNLQQELQASTCCQNYADIAAYNGMTISGAGTWSYGLNNNPWNAVGPVYLSGDLIFTAGSNITINGMEFRFGPQADVEIKTGAFVKLNSSSKWTSYECDGLMWPGVNLMGNPTQIQSPTDGPWTQQGILQISNSTIENARTGVEVGISSTTGGGVLKGYTATFLNCQNGVRYQPYSGTQYGAWNTSRWIIKSQLKDPIAIPGRMVRMTNMNSNIAFNGCSFIHDTPYQVYAMANRGTAIDASNSRFSLSGGSGSYSGSNDNVHTSFYKWRIGIKATNGGTTSFGSNSMYFQENNIGITANAINNESIVQNNFVIPSLAYISNERPRGVILTGCTGFTFRENYFVGISSSIITNSNAQNVGAMIVACQGAENLSYRNDFSQLWKGQEVQGDNRDGEELTGLQLRCNTYNNIRFDQYLASDAEWRHNQGDPNTIEMLANNRFSLLTPYCGDSRYDVYVDPIHPSSYEFLYIRPDDEWYDPNSSEPLNGSECDSPFMEDVQPSVYDDIAILNHLSVCPNLPVVTDPGERMLVHSEAINNLNLAKSIYTIVVDANQKTDIEIEINKAFPMESGLMRDYLITRSPLSDEILKETIDKLGLLDHWHLTQVLLTNSPLTKEVLVHLEQSNILNEFFMSFIYEADITGAANYRRLLEFEIAARESERHNALISLLDYYNQNADQVNVDAAVKNLMLIDGSLHAKLWLLEYYLGTNANSEAQDILAEIQNLGGMSDFVALKQIQLSIGNDWTLAHPGEIASLEIWASNPQSSAYGQAISVLHTLELTEVFPEPELPFEDRGSMTMTNRQRTVYLPELSAYPNPASDRTFVTYPSEVDGIGTLELYSPIGQLLDWYALNGNGVMELKTQNYPAGIYLLTIKVEGKSLVDCKLIVTE